MSDIKKIYTADACPRRSTTASLTAFNGKLTPVVHSGRSLCMDLLSTVSPALIRPVPINSSSQQSQAIVTPTLIYVSGQIPATKSGELVEGTIGEKTAACIANIKSILAAAGSSIDKVVKVNAFITDMKNFAEMNVEYEKHFTTKPARSCVAVHQLPKLVDVEIECIALP